MRQSLYAHLVALAAIMAMVILLPGCADMAFDGDENAPGDEQSDGKADGVEGEDNESIPKPEDETEPLLEPPMMSAQYAISLDSYITVVDGPDDDTPKEWTARFTGIVTTKMEDGQVFLKISPCTVQLPDIDGREVETNDAMIQRAMPAELPARIEWDEQGARLETDLGAMVAGARLTDPVNESLPTDDDDDRLVDIDEDGRTALTLRISGYRVYVVLRVKLNLQGEFLENGYIRGQSGVRVDLEVYGDSVPFVNVKEAMDRALGKLSLSDERHEFVMVPLDSTITICDEIPQLAFDVPTNDGSTDDGDVEDDGSHSDEPAPTPAEPAPTPADND
jgi:hypothetical protein